ncbi:unnamed protein product [Rhizophagus irregularis]|nr:unnamed protein product [Rhizophagus irregularis]
MEHCSSYLQPDGNEKMLDHESKGLLESIQDSCWFSRNYPPRAEIPEVVRRCRRAGVRIFMVTGDYSLTAETIARQCGILTSNKVDNIDDIIEADKSGTSMIRQNLDTEEDDYQKISILLY